MTSPQTVGGGSDQAGSRSNRLRRSHRAAGERGVALVEFAIIAPLIFALIVGMVTGGVALNRKNGMTNAVREGARLGATLEEPADDSLATKVRDRVVSLSGGELDNSQVCVQLIRKATAATETVRQSWIPAPGPETCLIGDAPSSAGIPAGECAVKVWARRHSALQVVLWSRNLTLEASAISRYERAGISTNPVKCAS